MIRSGFLALQKSIYILLLAAMAGCASGPSLVTQGFSCDMWKDGWGAKSTLLEYSYGNQTSSLKRQARDETGIGCAGGVWMPMPRAEFLYVKWRVKSTNEIIEDRVDLRERLPNNMKDNEVTFVIDDRQLYVYVVTPSKITKNLPKPPLRTWQSRHQVTYEIYPTDNFKTQETK